MKPHMSDAEWLEVFSSGRVEPGTHAEACQECRGEIARVGDRLRKLPEWTQVASARPDEFWSAQRAQVLCGIQGMQLSPVQGVPVLAWVVAVAIILVGMGLLGGGPAPAPQESRTVNDHELLLEVERMVESGGPDALAPATLLLPEISQNQQSSPVTQDQDREANHEN
jgi:hypothetical protein